MNVKKWVIPVLMAAAGLLASCPGDILKNLDNPMDPKASSYQGYHTVEGADEVEAHTPSDGAEIVFLVFSVNEVRNAQSYRLQIAIAYDFAETSLVYDKDDFPDRVLNAEASLIVGTLYYWRAAAKKDGVWGKWTEVREFMLGGGISTMNPANGASTTDTTPTFSWNAVSYSAGYELQLGDSLAGVESSPIQSIEDTSYTPVSALTNGQTHYWRVRAVDWDGQKGAWSAVHSLLVNWDWGTISGQSPADGSATTDTTPTFSWNAVPGAAGYELQLGDSRAGVESSPIQSVMGASYTPVSALTNGQTHYWRVRAVDWDGQKGAWSAVYSLAVSIGAVSGLSPADGASTTDSTPTLSWDAVPGAAGYELQFGDSRSGVESSPIQSVMGASYTPVSVLTNGQTHYWRVRAVDWDGQKGVWSAVYSLAVSIGAVSGLSPADGSSTTDTTPTLSWDAVPGAAGYELQLAESWAEVETAQIQSVTGAYYTSSSPLTNEQTHYWRVQAVDGDDQKGTWSAVHSLEVKWGAVSGLNPADGSTTTDTTPTLSWAGVPGAASYEVRIADSLAGLGSASSISVTGSSYTPTSALTNLQTHYWQVRAKDGDDQKGTWSAVHSLEVKWGAVSGLNPADGSTTTDTTPTLSWAGVPGAASYEVRIADSLAGLGSASSISVTGSSHTPTSALTNLQTHYWQVRAKDGDDQKGTWSAVHSLEVKWGAVSGLNPADGSTTTDTTPTLSWAGVPGAASYEVRIADSLAGLNSAPSASETDPSHTPVSALTNKQTHYWRVRAKDWAGQFGAWSNVHSLEVQLLRPDFVHVAGGIFQMGSTDSEAESDESPVHSVTVDSFYMAETEVTHRQYLEFLNGAGVSASGQLNGIEVVDMDDGDVAFSHDGTKFSFAASSDADDIDCPVMEVTWYGAVEYSNWLSEQEGLSKAYSISGTSVSWNQSANGYRLPTEAEWEYAARGGAQSNGYKYAGSNDVDEVGWYSGNSGNKIHPVKGKKANELGLYDMSGNVWEWCWDWYDSDYYSVSPGANPTGPSSGSNRVARGGSWSILPELLRVANRGSSSPGDSSRYLGFRLVLRTN